MLGRVRQALADLVRDLLDRTLALREHVDDLRPAAAPQGLRNGRKRVEERSLRSSLTHNFKLTLE